MKHIIVHPKDIQSALEKYNAVITSCPDKGMNGSCFIGKDGTEDVVIVSTMYPVLSKEKYLSLPPEGQKDILYARYNDPNPAMNIYYMFEEPNYELTNN